MSLDHLFIYVNNNKNQQTKTELTTHAIVHNC